MNINFHLEKQELHFSVIYNSVSEIDDPTEKLLLLQNVDFELSKKKKACCKHETEPFFLRCRLKLILLSSVIELKDVYQ